MYEVKYGFFVAQKIPEHCYVSYVSPSNCAVLSMHLYCPSFSQKIYSINYVTRTQLYFYNRIVHWEYNYMLRPFILAIVRLYYNLISSYKICAWGTVGGTRSRLTIVGDMALRLL
jgi:hypothetical protein